MAGSWEDKTARARAVQRRAERQCASGGAGRGGAGGGRVAELAASTRRPSRPCTLRTPGLPVLPRFILCGPQKSMTHNEPDSETAGDDEGRRQCSRF